MNREKTIESTTETYFTMSGESKTTEQIENVNRLNDPQHVSALFIFGAGEKNKIECDDIYLSKNNAIVAGELNDMCVNSSNYITSNFMCNNTKFCMFLINIFKIRNIWITG